MQEDFHFYTIYALSRSAGVDEQTAYIIAYSSQHTDDAKHEEALEFINGGRFSQTLTAHRFLDIDSLTKPVCYRIWIPYHFLPGNVGTEFYERMITRANSPVSKKMMDEILNLPFRPYSMHLFGIALHVYADTWSHQGFMGLIHRMNNIEDIRIHGEDSNFINELIDTLKRDILEYAAPELGHAQAGTIPDEPFRTWEYMDYKGRLIFRDNKEIALDSAQNCYMMIMDFSKRHGLVNEKDPVMWEKLIPTLDELFSHKGELKERISRWKNAISDGRFGFEPGELDRMINYEEKAWFKKAVNVIEDEGNSVKFERRPGFERSNWKHFHDGAVFFRFFVLHELLPQFGIICG